MLISVVPSYGISDQGFEAKSLDAIRDEMSSAVVAGVSPTLDVSDTTIDGQKLGAVATQARQIWEAMQALYADWDVEQATGAQLEVRLKPLIGSKSAATHSTASMTLVLAAGTYPAGSLIVYVSGDPNKRFSNDESITTGGGTLTAQPFTAELEGAVTANLHTLTQIASNPGGFTSATNPAAASTGLEQETDAEYRQRWREELARFGSTTVDAIRADLLEVTNVVSAKVYENDTAATVSGIPPYSILAVVQGGDDQDVADALWNAKSATAGTTGTTMETVVDTQGQSHSVSFTRPSEVPFYVTATVDVLEGVYSAGVLSNNIIEIAIHECGKNWGPLWPQQLAAGTLETGGDSWPVGSDIFHSRFVAAIQGITGVIRVVSLFIGTAPAPVGTSDITIALDEYGDIDYSGIVVTVNTLTGAP